MQLDKLASHATNFRFGVLVGLSLTLPLFGQVAGVPGRLISLAALTAALAMAFFLPTRRTSMVSWLFVGLATAYATLVVFASSADQFAFLLDFSRWRAHESHYYESKLLMLALTFGPCLLLVIAFCRMDESEETVRGMSASFLVMATLAAVRVALDADILIGADYATARPFYVGEDRGAYSTISFSAIFSMGAMVCVPRLAGSHAWRYSLLLGLFVFMMVWLNQRADTIFLIAACTIFTVLAAARYPEFRRWGYFASLIGSVAIAGVLFLALHNDVNLDYWADGGAAGFHDRVALAEIAVTSSDEGGSLRFSFGGYSIQLNLGRGLGSYAILHPDLLYPHNLFLETYFEIGTLGLLALGAAIMLGAATGSLRGLTGQFTPSGLAIWMIAALMLLNSMKAGDASSIGNILILLAAAMATYSKRKCLLRNQQFA